MKNREEMFGIVVDRIIDGSCAPFTKARKIKPRVHLVETARRRAHHDDPVNSSKNSNTRQNVLTGRPTVTINVGGKSVVCFVDTGIAVSLIKSSSLNTLKFASRARKARSLVGVTGALLNTIEEQDIQYPCL